MFEDSDAAEKTYHNLYQYVPECKLNLNLELKNRVDIWAWMPSQHCSNEGSKPSNLLDWRTATPELSDLVYWMNMLPSSAPFDLELGELGKHRSDNRTIETPETIGVSAEEAGEVSAPFRNCCDAYVFHVCITIEMAWQRLIQWLLQLQPTVVLRRTF